MTRSEKTRNVLRWLPAYIWQSFAHRERHVRQFHLIIALADHFEPAIQPDRPRLYADRSEQERRIERWCRDYPKIIGNWRDSDGRPFCHTYFYPAEQYDKGLVQRLSEHCRSGWGEVEIQLHHGVNSPDTSEHTRSAILEFKEALVQHKCLSLMDGIGTPRYAFVHGNWALANSAKGRFCGVDDEMEILSQTGCYADFTLPSAPNRAQVPKINSLYECALPLNRRAPHRRGQDLRSGQAPGTFPLIVQGPLLLGLRRQNGSWPRPYIENSAVSTLNPPTMDRLRLWRHAAVIVRGKPDWVFIKLHCHGMDPRDEAAMIGAPVQDFLEQLTKWSRAAGNFIHFVTAREMVNIILAACDGREGNPREYRDYRLRPIEAVRAAVGARR